MGQPGPRLPSLLQEDPACLTHPKAPIPIHHTGPGRHCWEDGVLPSCYCLSSPRLSWLLPSFRHPHTPTQHW